MSDTVNQCATCEHFDRYYVNETTIFKKTNYGRCSVRYKAVKECETCLNYCKRSNEKAYNKRTIKSRLAYMFAELAMMRSYLENENDT